MEAASRLRYTPKDNAERIYRSHLLRRSVREDTKVKNETLANRSHLPDELIEAIRLGLAGETLVVAGSGFELTRSLPTVTLLLWRLRLSRLAWPTSSVRPVVHATSATH